MVVVVFSVFPGIFWAEPFQKFKFQIQIFQKGRFANSIEYQYKTKQENSVPALENGYSSSAQTQPSNARINVLNIKNIHVKFKCEGYTGYTLL